MASQVGETPAHVRIVTEVGDIVVETHIWMIHGRLNHLPLPVHLFSQSEFMHIGKLSFRSMVAF
jgi:hypothetical protein